MLLSAELLLTGLAVLLLGGSGFGFAGGTLLLLRAVFFKGAADD